MSSLIQYMIAQGVPRDTVILILMLPVVATVIAFARQVVGIKAFGIYTPLIIAFAFLATGIKYGLAIFIVVLVSGTVMRLVIKYFHLLYLPRMAIVLTVVAFTILAMFWIGSFLGKTRLIATSIFPILIIITLVEKFIAAQIERGARTAVTLTFETLVLSIICYYIASWSTLQMFILAKSGWIILGTIILNIALGRWTGLRLTEYLRFREVIKSKRLE